MRLFSASGAGAAMTASDPCNCLEVPETGALRPRAISDLLR